MKKIIRRLLTGVLTLATVFTAFPVTQIHAADSVYTHSDGKTGTVLKVTDGGEVESTFQEGWMKADGETAYCIQLGVAFQSGYKTRKDATERLNQSQITDVALNLEYIKEHTKKGFTDEQSYLLQQCTVWRRLSVHLGWGFGKTHVDYDEISKSIQDKLYADAQAFAKANKDRYDCGGYIYVGEGQDLGQFWAKLAVGNGKIQKSSSNTTITKSNDCYSIAGATYGVYSDKGCTKSVATLTTDSNGNTDTVELRAATYFVKETKAPKGFQLDKNVYTLTVKAGETATLKVSDTPKVTDTLVELFKIDMETSKSTAQGNASLEGAEFVWKYYDGYYTKENLPSEPTRTWTTKTIAEKDSKNEVHYITHLADVYKVSGDSFYTQNGTICLPLGTITVEEKTAPKGYLLEGAYMQAAGSSEQIKGVYVAQITENGELAALSGSNQYSVSDKVTFTATDTKMEVQIAFTFNASELAGKELVTFEELYDVTNPDKPIKVAEHKDIKDEGQTVTIKEKSESPTTPEESSTPTKPSDSPKTGDNTPFAALLAMMGISAAGLIFAGYKRFRRVKKSN